MHALPGVRNEWDYPKWSNVNRFAVSSARNSAGNAHNVYLVNLSLGATLEMVSGVELEQPCLWVNNFPDLTPNGIDSLGAYNDPPVFVTQVRFAGRMHSSVNCAIPCNLYSSEVLTLLWPSIRMRSGIGQYTILRQPSISRIAPIKNYILPNQ